MKPIRRLAAAGALALLVPACSGGGGSTPSSFVVPPANVSPVDPAARAAAQGALLAEQAATLFVTSISGPVRLDTRRTPAARVRSNVSCAGGFAEQDTGSGAIEHRVVSLYFDPACASLRQTATLDQTFGVDTGSLTGTIVAYDAAGAVTVTQSVDEQFGIPIGLSRKTTDSTPGSTPSGPATVFGRTTLICPGATLQCSLAAVTDGPAFETGVVLSAQNLNATVPALSSASVPFTGSLSTGAVGSMTITQQLSQAPALSGGSVVGPFSGSLSIVPGIDGPAAFLLTLDTLSGSGAPSAHVIAAFANGTTTVTVAGGTTVTVNLNGDGTITYANGTTGRVLDYRIAS